MTIKTFTVSIIDDYPFMKLLINRDGVITKDRQYFDIAGSQFEPAVINALRLAVESALQPHQRGGK